MGSIRNSMAVMLSVMALAAFVSDAGAQTRRSSDVKKSKPAQVTRQAPEKPKSGSTVTRQAPPKRQNPPQNVKPGGKPDNKVDKPGNRPDVKPNDQPGNRPDVRPGDRPDKGPGSKPGQGPGMKPGNGPGHGPGQKPGQGPGMRPDHRPEPPKVRPPRHDRPDRYRYGYRVRVLPARAHRYVYHGTVYYFHDDIWYRPSGGYYVVCRPPRGMYVASDIISDIAWAAVRIAYYNAVANTAYRLAADIDVTQNYADEDSEYFYLDGVFYAKDSDGTYLVTTPPAGALVEALPEDFETVILKDGKEYYKVDDTVFRMTVLEGKPYFEVIGQQY